MNATKKILGVAVSVALLSILLISFYAPLTHSDVAGIVQHIGKAVTFPGGTITLDDGHHHHHDEHGCNCPNDIGIIAFSFGVDPNRCGEGTAG
jgi:hypothetical protein